MHKCVKKTLTTYYIICYTSSLAEEKKNLNHSQAIILLCFRFVLYILCFLFGRLWWRRQSAPKTIFLIYRQLFLRFAFTKPTKQSKNITFSPLAWPLSSDGQQYDRLSNHFHDRYHYDCYSNDL